MLHPQQEQAIAFLDSWLSSNQQLATLQGYAGTGKTFLVGQWISSVLAKHPRWQIYVLAPTNKALDVLREKCKHLPESHVAFFTIDSFLGNRIKRDDDGEMQKSRGRGQEIPDLIVCDEASMVKKEYDTDLRRKGCAKILYVGDPAQLPPINEDLSSCFTIPNTFLMTQVVRFEGSIIKIATMLRQKIESKDLFFIDDLRARKEDNTVSFIRIDSVYEWALNAHSKNLDCRIVAFDNLTVNYHNKVMHESLYPHAPLFGIGEKIIVNETYELNDDEKLYNGELLTVTSCELAEPVASVVIYDVKFTRDIDGKTVMSDVEYIPQEFKVQVPLNESHMLDRRKSLTNEIWECRKLGNNPKALIDLRRPLNRLAPLRHSYSNTVHKSQGSTYDVAFCDWVSIYKCPDRARMMYVAATRPSKFLVVCTK